MRRKRKEKKYKRAGNVLLLFLTGTFFCTGCGESFFSPKTEMTEVTVWNYYNGDQLAAFEKLVAEFNETVGAKENIIVVSVSQGSINNLVDALLDAVSGKAGADDIPSLAAVYGETACLLQEQQVIVDLDDYFTKEELEEYIPSFIEEGRFTQGKELWQFPALKSTEALIINETDWKKFEESTGIKSETIQTVEAMVSASEAYYEYTDALTPDIPEDGKALYGRNSLSNYIYVGAKQLGHEISFYENDTAKIDLDRETFYTLWKNYYIPYINGYFMASNAYRTEDMKIGNVLAITSSTSGINYVPSHVIEEDDKSHFIDVSIRLPLFFEDAVTEAIVQQGAGYCVFKTSEAEQEGAVTFLKWFTDTERNLNFSVSSAYSPVKIEANQPQKIEEVYRSMKSGLKETVLDGLLLSSDIYLHHQMYTPKVFEQSKEIRSLFEKELENICTQDRALVEDRIKTGMSRKEATEEFMTEEYFQLWFDNLVAKIEKLLTS